MHRMILRLSAAFLTFFLGVVITAIYHLNGSRSVSPPPVLHTVDLKMEVPFPNASCYPGESLETAVLEKTPYFPPKVLSENERSHQFRADWYSQHLRAMKEAPLHSQGWSESYRFLWLRTFHHPVAVRIWKCGSERFISVKELNGAGGYEPGKLIFNHERRLTAAEWSEFMRRVEDACYWQLPTEDESFGTDGAQWIFEGVREGRYHIVDRWTPQSGNYRELCLYALQLSGLKVAGEDVY